MRWLFCERKDDGAVNGELTKYRIFEMRRKHGAGDAEAGETADISLKLRKETELLLMKYIYNT